MSLYIELPYDEARVMRAILRKGFEFTETDHCEFTRPDGARATYGPSEAPR